MRTILALLPLLLLGASDSDAGNIKLNVYHTNDIHGWIMKRPAQWTSTPERMIGGAAALASFYGADHGPKLLLDGGDWFQGTPEGTVSRGGAVIEAFNALPYDAVVVGNHDFDFAEARLKELVALSKVPVLGANLYRDGARVGYLTPWMIKEVGGVKVGLFGLLTTNMRNLTFLENFEGLSFRREIDEAKDAVAALKKAGATVIIALTHVGLEQPHIAPFEGDKSLAAAVPGIDMIVGGHTHTFIEPFRDAQNGTLIAQAGFYLSSVGKVTLEIDPASKKVVYSTGTLVPLWVDRVGEDERVAGVVARQAAAVSKAYDVVVATAAAPLTRNRFGEASLGSWMTDCAREWAKSDVAIQNGGGIRADIDAGPITLREIFNVMPFDNFMVKLKIKGRALRDALDHGVNRGIVVAQVSGPSYVFDRDRPIGSRLSELTVGGRPIDLEKTYSLTTVDFLVKGGDGYKPLSEGVEKEYTRVLMREVLNDCARRQGTVVPPAPGRVRLAKEAKQ